MSKVAQLERIGTVLKLVESGKEAEIVRSYKVSGEFPAHETIEVTFDFARQEDGTKIVHLTRFKQKKASVRKTWTLAAIEDRDSKGLGGFIEFAASLGLKGAQLAKIIEGFKPVD